MSTKPFFLTYMYIKRETEVRKNVNGLVDRGFLLTGQQTRLVPFHPTHGMANNTRQTDGGPTGSVDTGLKWNNTHDSGGTLIRDVQDEFIWMVCDFEVGGYTYYDVKIFW